MSNEVDIKRVINNVFDFRQVCDLGITCIIFKETNVWDKIQI